MCTQISELQAGSDRVCQRFLDVSTLSLTVLSLRLDANPRDVHPGPPSGSLFSNTNSSRPSNASSYPISRLLRSAKLSTAHPSTLPPASAGALSVPCHSLLSPTGLLSRSTLMTRPTPNVGLARPPRQEAAGHRSAGATTMMAVGLEAARTACGPTGPNANTRAAVSHSATRRQHATNASERKRWTPWQASVPIAMRARARSGRSQRATRARELGPAGSSPEPHWVVSGSPERRGRGNTSPPL